MSLGRKIVDNTLIQIFGKIVSVIVAIGAIALLTRYLGAEQFGWYTTSLTFLQFFGILADFGLVLVTSQMLAAHPRNQQNIIHNLFSFRLLTAFVIIGIAPIIVLLFPYPIAVKQAVGLMTVMFFSISLQQIFTGLFQEQLAMKWSVLAEVTSRILLIAGVALTMYLHLGFLAAILAIVFANVVQLFILALAGMKFISIKLSYDKKIWHEIIQKSYPIALAIFFNMIYLRSDILILSLQRSQAEVGLYGAAYKILDVLTQAPIMFMGLMLPILTQLWVHKKTNQFKQMLQKSFRVFMIIGIPIIAGGLALAHPIMKLIAGNEFAASGTVAQILFLALIGGFLGALFGHVIVAINKQKHVIWIYTLVAAVALTGYLITIPTLGMVGAAWVTVLSELLAGILLTRYVICCTNIRITWKTTFIKTVTASVIMIIPILLLPHLHVLVLTAIGMVTYAAAALILKIISTREIRSLIKNK